MKKISILIATLLITLPFAFANNGEGVQTGTEVPWPYTAQQPVTEKNSKGLWWANTSEGAVLYNVEIFDTSKGHSWMRVTELDPWTYEIRTYGEGFYCQKEESNEGKDGRYVYMSTHADKDMAPYPLRVVEVDMGWGVLLGLSIYHSIDNPDHILAYRQDEEPLDCYYPSNSMDLVCDSVELPTTME